MNSEGSVVNDAIVWLLIALCLAWLFVFTLLNLIIYAPELGRGWKVLISIKTDNNHLYVL